MNTTTVALILIIAVIAIGALLLFERVRSRRLRQKFGPEYDRVVAREGKDAERVLHQRQKRVEKFHVHQLPSSQELRYSNEWHVAQASFVNDPRAAVAQADYLVSQALHECGYPISDFDQVADDLSVDHPGVVENYRAAHQIAMSDQSGQADTEDLRKAMQHYRSVFDDVLATRTT
jgi:hypothetical protein